MTSATELVLPRPIWPRRAWRWSIWLVYGVTWTWALETPYPRVVRVHPEFDWQVFLFGKFVHVSAFAVFAILSGWLLVPRPYRWGMLLFLSAHAWGTELCQQFVPSRYPSLRDVGLDHLGIVLGVALSWKWWRSK